MTNEQKALARARSLIAIGRNDQALVALVPALTAPSTTCKAHCLAASCYLAMDRPRKAVDAAARAVAVDPNNAEAHRVLAVSHLRIIGRRKRALVHAEHAARLDPHSLNTLHTLAISQGLNRQPALAQATAEAALEMAPHDPLAHYTAALTAEWRGDLGDAEDAYRAALAITPDNHDYALGLANVLRRLGAIDEASDTYLAAARAGPTDPAARQGLVELGACIRWPYVVMFISAATGALLGGNGVLARFVDTPSEAAVIAVALFGLTGGGLTLARIHGNRYLPTDLRRRLLSDHIQFARIWLGLAGCVALGLALWAAATPGSGGGGATVTVALLLFGAAAVTVWRGHGISDLRKLLQ